MSRLYEWKEGELKDYLSTFLERHPCKAVSEVVYCPTLERYAHAVREHRPNGVVLTEEEIKKHWAGELIRGAMAYVICDPYALGLHRPAGIFVFSAIGRFDLEEILSILRDHEYVHASDWAEGISISSKRKITLMNCENLSPDVIHYVMEVRAYENQLKSMPDNVKDRRIYRIASRNYAWNVNRLRERLKMDLPSSFERRVIREFLTSNSSP
ncbi:hypothetical protein HYT55_00280 [Candidatus Woesearchaeota archaeon]|nr:hypothetical protein [Candidatus Woesearchaeota archaeon]